MGATTNTLSGLLILHLIGVCQPLFVPDQLTTILSFLYTNIPPIRKGTDSRVGLGFRLGQNADFQVLFELGPQQNTAPIGNAGGSAKRDTKYVGRLPSTWLDKWHLNQETPNERPTSDSNNHPVLDQDVVNHLRQLYKTEVVEEENTVENDVKT